MHQLLLLVVEVMMIEMKMFTTTTDSSKIVVGAHLLFHILGVIFDRLVLHRRLTCCFEVLLLMLLLVTTDATRRLPVQRLRCVRGLLLFEQEGIILQRLARATARRPLQRKQWHRLAGPRAE